MKSTLLVFVALVAISFALTEEEPHALSAINPAHLLTQIEAGVTLAITFPNGAGELAICPPGGQHPLKAFTHQCTVCKQGPLQRHTPVASSWSAPCQVLARRFCY